MSESRISFGRAFFVSAIVIVGCGREAAPNVADAAPGPATAQAPAVMDASVAAETVDASAPDASSVDPRFSTAKPVFAKSVGHTSVVLKMRLEGGLDAAYKPESKTGHTRYRGEIAAYRLGRALGISNVPPAFPRTFDAAQLKTAGGADKIFDEVVNHESRVNGALIPWIKGLDFLPLEKDPWNAKWHAWLAKGGEIPDDQRAIASQISTMIVFDYVTGNWDRWSGGNVGTDSTKSTILYIDNDGAFFDPPPAQALAKQLGILEKVDRYSRAFVAALRSIDLKATFGDDTKGTPLLSPRVLEQTEARRKKALSLIDAKVKSPGEKDIFIFE